MKASDTKNMNESQRKSSNIDDACVVTYEVTALRRYMPQILAVIIKNLVMFVYGISIGMPTLLIPSLSGQNPNETIVLGEEGISWIASLNNLCVPVGCLLSGSVSQKLGRKISLLIVCVPFLVAFLLIHFSSKTWYIFFALALCGTAGGLSEAPGLSYATEVSEPRLRGALSSTSTLFICIGILFSFIVGTFLPWRIAALVYAAVPLASFFIVLFIPETPYWLLSRNKVEEAQKSLAWFRGWTTLRDVEKEFQEMQTHLKENSTDKNNICTKTTWKLFTEMRFIKPFLLIFLTFVICHFGITPITVYAINIFNSLQVPISPYYATIITWSANLLGVITCSLALRFLGKRNLSFISLTGISASFLLVGIYSHVNAIYSLNISVSEISTYSPINWIPLVFVVTAGFCNYLLINSLPWILMGEIYYNEIRDAGTGISAAVGYFVIFLANKTFLNLIESLTLAGMFWFYSGVSVCGLLLLYFLLPETEGKTLFDIAEHYKGGVKLSNKM